MSIWKIGETNALLKFKDYLNKKVLRYSHDRNDPIFDGTSRISPYLSSGIISQKDVYWKLLRLIILN